MDRADQDGLTYHLVKDSTSDADIRDTHAAEVEEGAGAGTVNFSVRLYDEGLAAFADVLETGTIEFSVVMTDTSTSLDDPNSTQSYTAENAFAAVSVPLTQDTAESASLMTMSLEAEELDAAVAADSDGTDAGQADQTSSAKSAAASGTLVLCLADRFGSSVLNASMLACLLVPDLSGTDSDGNALTWSLAGESAYATLAEDGTLSLTEAGITALAEAAAAGETLELSLTFAAGSGEEAVTQTLALTLDTTGVEVIASENAAWAFGTGEADELLATEVVGSAAAAGASEEEDSIASETALSSDAPVTLYGGEGDDFLAGGSGADSLYGGAGSDILVGDSGDLVLDGGEGFDLLVSADADLPNLADLLDGVEGAPQVSGMEVLLKGDALADVASRGDVLDLLAASNASFDGEKGEITLGEGWSLAGTNTGAAGTETQVWQYQGEDGTSLELEAVVGETVTAESGDVQQAVLVLSTTSV